MSGSDSRCVCGHTWVSHTNGTEGCDGYSWQGKPCDCKKFRPDTDEAVKALLAEPFFNFRRCKICGYLIGGYRSIDQNVMEMARHAVEFHATVQWSKMRDFEAPLV